MVDEYDNKIRSTVIELVDSSPTPHPAHAVLKSHRRPLPTLSTGLARMALVVGAVLLAGVIGLLIGRNLEPLPDVVAPEPSLANLPSEFEFFASVVECTEERTGREFGDMTEGPLGLASPEAIQALIAAQGHESAYADCFQEMLPPVPPISPIRGYGDYSGEEYSEIDWFEVTAAMAECAQDQGFPVKISPSGDGIGGFGSSGVHLSEITSAVVAACRDGLNLPSYPTDP